MNRKYYIRYKDEKVKPFLNKRFGIEEIEIDNAENIDLEIDKIKNMNKYNGDNIYKNNFLNKNSLITIFISDEIASFSSNVVNKYKSDKNIKIVII